MVSQSEKKRVAQHHMDAIAAASGPVYGVRLIDELPICGGMMMQAMPNKRDLEEVRKISERTVAGYEVLLSHYRSQTDEVARLKELIREVIAGRWCITDLQESIGDV